MNNIRKQISRVSLRGRVAIIAMIIEQTMISKSINIKLLSDYVDFIWEFVELDMLDDWSAGFSFKVKEIESGNIEEPKGWSLVDDELKALFRLAEQTGAANMLASIDGVDEQSIEHVIFAVDYARKNNITLPDIEQIKYISSFSQAHGWGKAKSISEFKRCR